MLLVNMLEYTPIYDKFGSELKKNMQDAIPSPEFSEELDFKAILELNIDFMIFILKFPLMYKALPIRPELFRKLVE